MPELFLLLVVLSSLSLLIWTFRNKISPMPTSPKVKRKLLEILPKQVDGTILELGAGWGTLLFPLAMRYPHNKVIGYETSPLPFAFCWLRTLFTKNAKIVRKDFFTVSFEDASLIVCYLYPEAMWRLQEKFSALKKGTWIVSNTFTLPDWEPERIIQVNDLYRTQIYIYKKD